MNNESLSLWREFARVFIPSALLFGAASNLVNFVTLSRPNIRACSTKIYLTVLTFTDTSLLVSIFLLSKQFRHVDAHSHENEVYWKTFGLTRWFHIAFVYISVYLTLFLTIDRYYCSLQQQQQQQRVAETTCRISKARNTASMVVFVCLLVTISSAFEIKLEAKDSSEIIATTTTANEHAEQNWNVLHNSSAAILPSHSHIRRNETSNDDVNVANLPSNKTSGPVDSVVGNNRMASGRNHSDNASNGPSFHLFPVESDLARSKFYRVIFKPIASLLQLIPFIMMGFFVWKLAVDARRRGRGGLVVQNVSCSLPQRQHQQQHRPDMLIRGDEQQLSRLVIALVVIFLICHTPNAVYSLCQAASNFLSAATFASDDDDDSTASRSAGEDDRKIGKKFGSGFEILCLVLMCISCCSKLFLYLLAYDEFLASIKSFTTSCLHDASSNNRDERQPVHSITSKAVEFTTTRKKSLPQILLTHSQSESKLAGANVSTPLRHTHRHRLTSISIPVADFIEQQPPPARRRMSMMPSVSYGGVFSAPIRLQTANEMRQARRVNRQASTRSQRVTPALANPSSSSNLARSRSLAALHSHSHMMLRHSPNCKLRRIADDET